MDEALLEQFSSMGTTDRDVLIQQFVQYVGGAADAQSSAFFLEMNNWNLQEALGTYFEYQAKNEALPSMVLVEDRTVGEGESVGPEMLFSKKWRVVNDGIRSWPEGCYLAYSRGHQIGPCTRVNMPALAPGKMADIELTMMSPDAPGYYCSEWRMCVADGSFFGDTVWVIIQVESSGLLDLMQQMSSLSTSAAVTTSTFCSVTVIDETPDPQVGVLSEAPQVSQAVLPTVLPLSNHVGHLSVDQTEDDMSALTLGN